MSHHEPMTASGKPAVRNERSLAPQPSADDGARRTQHLTHAWAALRPLISNDDHVARLDLAAENALQRFFLRVEHPRPTLEAESLLSGNLCNRALRRKIAVQDDQVTIFL